MSVTITVGKEGQLVIPQIILDDLGLREGTRLHLESRGGKLEATPEYDEARIEMKDGFPVIVGGPPRGENDIVNAIKAGRDERDERILAYRRKA